MKYLFPFILIFALFLQAIPATFAGGSSAGVYETNVRDKYLIAGETDQLLLSFTVEPWAAIPGDLTVDSLDITCAPSHGFTTIKLMDGDIEMSSATFETVKMSGNQQAHLEASEHILPNGTATELSLLVTVEENTSDFITACAIDDMFLKNTENDRIFSSEAQSINFDGINRLIYVEDLNIVNVRDASVPNHNIFDSRLRPSNLELASENNLLMDLNINAPEDIKLQDLFIFCERGNIIQNYRLEIDGVTFNYPEMQNNSYSNSRPEHSRSDRIIFKNLNTVTGYGKGVNLKLYGDTYNYFSHMPDDQMACSIIDIRTETHMPYPDTPEGVVDFEASLVTNPDSFLTNRLLGTILLQVQTNGQAWYLDPISEKKYYLPNGTIAYEALRNFGLGITDADLDDIPFVDNEASIDVVDSICESNSLANRVKGRILLQVEQHGEAWYVHPEKCYRVYMKDGNAAYNIMRFLSLGITDEDIRKIPVY